MAVGVYVGVGGVQKELTGVYIGVGGAVKEVQEIYVGVGGVPKLVWQNGTRYFDFLAEINADASGVVEGIYNITEIDTTYSGYFRVVGKATVEDMNGSENQYLRIPLPFQPPSTTSSSKINNYTVDIYNKDGTAVSYQYKKGDSGVTLSSYKSNISGEYVGNIRLQDSAGWKFNGDRKADITFDYYVKTDFLP